MTVSCPPPFTGANSSKGISQSCLQCKSHWRKMHSYFYKQKYQKFTNTTMTREVSTQIVTFNIIFPMLTNLKKEKEY